MSNKLLRGRYVNLSLAAAVALAAGTAGALASGPEDRTPRVPSSESITLADSLSTAFRDASAAVSPSVVNINTVEKAQQSPQINGRGMSERDLSQIPEPFRRFFGMDPNQQSPFNMQPSPMPERRGEGSGVIIRQNGYILTNNHVVEGADQITVRLDTGREYEAKVIGTDPESDLAVIKIEANDLPAARFGDSEELRPGDWIVAVGNPFGLDHTVTAGVVSAIGRGGMGLTTYEDFIQTDAAINPGNSGGPMINLHGEVVGINSAIRSASGGNNGIGFAIPSSIALNVADSLIDSGKVERGWLGVSIQQLTPELASSFGYQGTDGALISQVISDTPAAKAGIEPGDIVTSINNREVDSPRELMNTIAQHKPGEKITLTLARDGSTKSYDVKLGERPGQEQLASGSSAQPDQGAALGMQVQPLTSDLADQLGIEQTRGLLVTQVNQGSPAAQAGLQAEDVILEAARKPVDSASQLSKAAQDHKDGLLLKVARDGRTIFLVVKPGN